MGKALMIFVAALIAMVSASPVSTEKDSSRKMEENIKTGEGTESEFTIRSSLTNVSEVIKQLEVAIHMVYASVVNGTTEDANGTMSEILQVNGTPYYLNTTVVESKRKSDPDVIVHLSSVSFAGRKKRHSNNMTESKEEEDKTNNEEHENANASDDEKKMDNEENSSKPIENDTESQKPDEEEKTGEGKTEDKQSNKKDKRKKHVKGGEGKKKNEESDDDDSD